MALHFELVTPAKLVRSEDVHMVVVPGSEGEFGVLEGHAPFMSTIRDGAVQVYKTEGAAPESIEVRGGFAEVGENGLTVLAEHVEGRSQAVSPPKLSANRGTFHIRCWRSTMPAQPSFRGSTRLA